MLLSNLNGVRLKGRGFVQTDARMGGYVSFVVE
jgi:predicted nucleic acid-binding Zn ribbon protein